MRQKAPYDTLKGLCLVIVAFMSSIALSLLGISLFMASLVFFLFFFFESQEQFFSYLATSWQVEASHMVMMYKQNEDIGVI
jgi:hypothetical protein